jgi:hypothetical protein
MTLLSCAAALQAAFAAYSAIATQAATVVGAMDKVWSGGDGPETAGGQGGGSSESGTASAQEQQARLAVALQNSQDGDDVYVQVSHLQHKTLFERLPLRSRLQVHSQHW